MALLDTLRSLASTHAVDFSWAQRKFSGYYHRYLTAEAVGQRFGELCLEAADRLADGP